MTGGPRCAVYEITGLVGSSKLKDSSEVQLGSRARAAYNNINYKRRACRTISMAHRHCVSDSFIILIAHFCQEYYIMDLIL